MTRTVTEESVKMNLSLRRVKPRLAIEKIGTIISLKDVSPLPASPLKKRGRIAVIKRVTHQATVENPMKFAVGMKPITGYISYNAACINTVITPDATTLCESLLNKRKEIAVEAKARKKRRTYREIEASLHIPIRLA
jgi:hypothetical protein